jgi:hypothetical protein
VGEARLEKIKQTAAAKKLGRRENERAFLLQFLRRLSSYGHHSVEGDASSRAVKGGVEGLQVGRGL